LIGVVLSFVSKATKKKALSFMIGPPKVKPSEVSSNDLSTSVPLTESPEYESPLSNA
jgi:hypothetical protein